MECGAKNARGTHSITWLKAELFGSRGPSKVEEEQESLRALTRQFLDISALASKPLSQKNYLLNPALRPDLCGPHSS